MSKSYLVLHLKLIQAGFVTNQKEDRRRRLGRRHISNVL